MSSVRMRIVGVVLYLLAACGGGGGTGAPDAGGSDAVDPLPIRVPALDAVRPPEVAAGSGALVLEADGEFDPDAVVLLDGAPLTTRVLSASTLEADVPGELLASPATRWVQVVHTGAGGGFSEERSLRVVFGTATPVLDVLVPDRVTAGAAAFEVTVHGWNFTAASEVRWAGAARATTFVDSTEVRFHLDAADVAAAGSFDVTVETAGADPSTALAFTVNDAPTGIVGVIARVSVTAGGLETEGGIDPSISADGRYVAFSSSSSELVTGDGCCEDVFVRDTTTSSLIRVSVSSTGGDIDGYARHAAISGDGRYVAFVSNATNLAATPTTGQQVWVRDTCTGATGCTPSTTQVSLRSDGGQPLADSEFPAISADGRYVAFVSQSPDIVVGDTDTRDVYLRDTCAGATGCTPSTIRISESTDGTGGDDRSSFPTVSATGRYVAFQSVAVNLDGQPATAFRRHGYVRDTCLGATGCTPSVTRVDVGTTGEEADANVPSERIAISDDGRYVAFASLATNLTAADTAASYQVYRRDTCAGATACTPSTVLVSTTGAGGASASVFGARISGDGRCVAFVTDAPDLVAGDTNGWSDVFVRDLDLGETRRVSVSAAGVQGDDYSGGNLQWSPPHLSFDGGLVVFGSLASTLVLDDTNGAEDAFLAATELAP